MLNNWTPQREFSRTAYKITKQDRPFDDFPCDIELQEISGLNMGRVLHTHFSCANLTDHIGKEMRKKREEIIVKNNIKIGVRVN